jgi:hypothetical protein
MKTLAAAALLVLVGACGSDPAPTSTSGTASPRGGPDDAVRQLMTSLDAGSCDDVKDLVVTPATVDCDQLTTLAGSFSDADLAQASFEAGPVEGDSTTVTITWRNGDPAEIWQAERIDGTWKVLFDSVD